MQRTGWKRRVRKGPVSGRPAMDPGVYAHTVRAQVLERDGGCANPACRRTRDLQVDHVLPRSQGAPDDPAVLVTLCRSCNALKEQGVLIVMPNGDGTFRFFDTRQVGPLCQTCFGKIAAGELMAVPSRVGAVRWVTAQ